MAAGDIGEAAEAAMTTKSRRTINDFLGEGDDGEGAATSPPSPETPPRLRLPRFTCARIRFGRLGRKRGDSRGSRNELAAPAVKSEGASSADSPSAPAAAAAQTGMGLSMLLLLARTCVELNRMAEVRAQMEALLQEIRDEASRVKGAADADHVHAAATPKTCTDNNLGSSSSCVSGTSTTNCLEDTGRGEDFGKRAASGDEARAAAGTDALEAELAPRQSPEWKCDAEEETPECSMHSLSDSDDEEEFIELEGGRFGGGGGGRGGGGGGGVGDRDGGGDAGEDDGSASSRERDEGGVSAVELERRLHELRHRRDRERIAALESALRRAERRVTEKEMEARLWQDTATLALGQPPATGRDGQ
ncbi:unnamed protein product [Urochloa decumbens]|uniref:Protein POLAR LOCALIZATION DURING ASYMMETRIC DIVISION AND REDISTRIBUTION n=1 Tax=Urochloa decumbens TaxID=240449 RepID=A0ABC9A2W9_9POAL